MHKPNKKNHSPQKSVDWLQYIEDCLPALVIPVGPRFQADVPEWTGPCIGDGDTKWLGTRTWPFQDGNAGNEGGKIGKGRPDSCSCSYPGSAQCIKQHIIAERTKFQLDLGPAYKSWKFDEMGEYVAKSWSWKQEKKFESLVKENPLSEGKSFLKPAEASFPSKTRKDIVNYYLNVYVPKRIGMITLSGVKVTDSDDDEAEVKEKNRNAKNSLKRSRPQSTDSTKLAKPHYLTGRR